MHIYLENHLTNFKQEFKIQPFPLQEKVANNVKCFLHKSKDSIVICIILESEKNSTNEITLVIKTKTTCKENEMRLFSESASSTGGVG